MNTDEIFKIICGIMIVVNGIYFLKCRKKLFSFLLSGILGFAALVLLNKYGLFIGEVPPLNKFNIAGSIILGVPYVVLAAIIKLL